MLTKFQDSPNFIISKTLTPTLSRRERESRDVWRRSPTWERGNGSGRRWGPSRRPQSRPNLKPAVVAALLFALAVAAPAAADETAPLIHRLSGEIDELSKLFPERPARNSSADVAWQNLGWHLRRARVLLQRGSRDESETAGVADEIALARAELARISHAEQAPKREPGAHEEGYCSENDGSFQPFLVHLPAGDEETKGRPLLVFLHGYSPYLEVDNWTEMIPQGCYKLADDLGFVFAAPFGRGNTDYQGIGEQDVLNVIEEMKRRYGVDADRVVISGLSMGAMGAWNIAAHYPHLFAGLLVISGRADWYAWKGVDPDALPPWKRNLIEGDFAAELGENLAAVPVYAVHGSRDTMIPYGEFEAARRRIAPAHPGARFVSIENGSHWIHSAVLELEDVRRWLSGLRRAIPAAFNYATYHPRYSRAHWVSVKDFGPLGERKKITGEAKDGKILISATGLRSLVLNREFLPAECKSWPCTVAGNLQLSENNSRESPPLPLPAPGPLREVFLDPFLFVQADGGSGSEFSAAFNERRYEWYRYARGWPRAVLERQASVAVLDAFNLVLFGEPETSPLVRKVLSALAIKVGGEAIELAGEKLPRAGTGLWVVTRNPWQSARVAAVNSGLPWGTRLAENHKYDFIPDFMVYAPETEGEGFNKAVCAGFWDADGRPQASFLQFVRPVASSNPVRDRGKK